MCLNSHVPVNLFPEVDYRALSGLSLAFIGDAVYEVFIRNYILSRGEARVKDLHRDTVRLVNADFQADIIDVIMPHLSEDEIAVFKRGRNAHAGHTPKNKSEAQYHKSTGFEALVGYLYLKKDFDRLSFIFSFVCTEDKNG